MSAAAWLGAALLWLVIIDVGVILHEGVHFLVARAQGAAVKTFSLGMGPVLLRRQLGGTEWRLSAFPVGGYVEIDGMAQPPGEPPRGFSRLPLLGKLATLLAAPLSNLALGVLLLAAVFMGQGVVTATHADQAEIYRVLPGSAASHSGLEAGDRISAIDGRPLPKSGSGYLALGRAIKAGGTIQLTLLPPGRSRPEQLAVHWTPHGHALFGVSYGPATITRKPGILRALALALGRTTSLLPAATSSLLHGVASVIARPLRPSKQVVGPIGSVQLVGRSVQQGGLWGFFEIAYLINLSLGLFNLLPIPGLDGGRALLVLLRALIGRRFKSTLEDAVNLVGFAFLILFMALVVVSDVVRVSR